MMLWSQDSHILCSVFQILLNTHLIYEIYPGYTRLKLISFLWYSNSADCLCPSGDCYPLMEWSQVLSKWPRLASWCHLFESLSILQKINLVSNDSHKNPCFLFSRNLKNEQFRAWLPKRQVIKIEYVLSHLDSVCTLFRTSTRPVLLTCYLLVPVSM